ncbi:MAG: SDR family oxidoreductase [Desulfocurvibacter africanus]
MGQEKEGEFPPQKQEKQPGTRQEMEPKPKTVGEGYKAAGKLEGKVAIITGGDSGIGRATAIHFAKEGADVCIVYLDEHDDAKETKQLVEKIGRKCLLIAGDVSSEVFCGQIVDKALQTFGRLDVLVNHAGVQYPQERLEDISAEQLEKTFRVNIFAYFYLTKAALPHLKEGASIINTTSITAYRGHPILIDYASTKSAIVGFTRSLALNLAEKGIRVNAVAPGPIWTPLIPSSFSPEHTAKHGQSTPMSRAGQPEEVAPTYVYLASRDSSYVTGQVLHVNGGMIVNG